MTRLAVFGAGSMGAQIAQRNMYKTTGDERFRPSAQLEAKVKAGKLGRKTKEGWYKY